MKHTTEPHVIESELPKSLLPASRIKASFSFRVEVFVRDRIMANKTLSNTTRLCLYTTQDEANENIEYSERMSEVIPANYMIWKLGFILLFLAIVVYTCIEIYKRIQAERQSPIQKFDIKSFLYKPKNTTLSLILIASFLRVLWLIDPHERSVAFWGHVYGTGRKGRAAVEILLKVPQVLLMSVVLLQIKIWRETVNKVKYMSIKRRVKSAAEGDAPDLGNRIVTGLAVVLLTIGLTSAMLYATGIVDLSNLSNAIFGCYSLFLCLAGSYYTYQLHNIISKMMESNHKSAVSAS